MDGEQRLKKRLTDLVSPDYSPAMAYPLRARLARVVNESTQWLNDGAVHPPDIAESVQLLRDLSSHLMQPSEPFDGRWQEQWIEVRRHATLIQHYLMTNQAS
jgi:hypothetical protein